MQGVRCTGGNVIIFGQSGVGKSSIVNMLLGENRIKVNADAKGCTFTSDPYVVDVGGGVLVRVHDTAGLGEGSAGTITSADAIAALYKLLRNLNDGVNLLVFVMRVGRIVKTDEDNYKLFCKGFCASEVPIALVLTHGDNCITDEDDDDEDSDPDDIAESAMKSWLDRNRALFTANGLTFNNEAIVIAKKRGFPKTHESSRDKLRLLVSMGRRFTPWKMETNAWYIMAVKSIFNYVRRLLPFTTPAQLAPQLTRVLTEYGGVSRENAITLANQVESGLT